MGSGRIKGGQEHKVRRKQDRSNATTPLGFTVSVCICKTSLIKLP
jgi:hypothetical protein